MPGISRKILICAAIDGLILQPLPTKGQRPFQPVRIRYGDSSISAVPRDQIPDTSDPNSSFEVFGVIGKTSFAQVLYAVEMSLNKFMRHQA